MNVLVTGGAGYIGSHVVRALVATGHRVTVLDDLSNGRRAAIPGSILLVEDSVLGGGVVSKLLADRQIDSIVHLAARIEVGESVSSPRTYYEQNVLGGLAVLNAAVDQGVKRFIFSSSAAVYGNPVYSPIDERHPLAPINPYGDTKLAMERALTAYAKAYDLAFVALRYFNACGADPAGGIGEDHHPETHLIPLALRAAIAGSPFDLFGDDHPTPDGTCVRDFVHVQDIAEAHSSALDYLQAGGSSTSVNIGTGRGQSVRDVLRAVEDTTGRAVPVVVRPRRVGDPSVLLASPGLAHDLLGWRASRPDVRTMVHDALAWHTTRAARP